MVLVVKFFYCVMVLYPYEEYEYQGAYANVEKNMYLTPLFSNEE